MRKRTQFKLEAQRRPLRVSFLETANQGPIFKLGVGYFSLVSAR